MNKEKVARLFFESFRTDIKSVDFKENDGKIVFHNHFAYKKTEFTNDFNGFTKKVAKECGVNVNDIKDKEESGCKTFYYKWDPEYIISIEGGIQFRMGRRMMNEAHAVIDGVNHEFYVRINDIEIVEEINRLNNEQIATNEEKKKNEWPDKKENLIKKCGEMIETLQGLKSGDIDMVEEHARRIEEAHFQLCVMIGSYV